MAELIAGIIRHWKWHASAVPESGMNMFQSTDSPYTHLADHGMYS
jgi:hypothetical protein